MIEQVVYRTRQFFRAVLARVSARDDALVDRQLAPAQAALFRRMSRIDQRHCLDVFYTLQQAGYRDEALLQAALLHDAGKADHRLTMAHRVAVVLMCRFAPGWLERLAQDASAQGASKWKAGFAAHLQHAQVGAQWAAQAASSPQVVWFIREHHQFQPKEHRLAALQWADGQN